ncbi:MAG: hypothetical protein DWQ34_07565 [Planctomycetota bacterium]|nr:MAG: hypothetical protein DWQ34_07565 [Planctomycetota bacterium]REJ95580.1 MAG: hypothetical protein DWQ29_01900 [Planctomycetota bacterium]REK30743.1 MAG: hypothetical protein DWQ41_01990 [Planctomycetota bacterium]REK33118.1 MAG: hypothetical protein DWQ45_16095 [Planctomycetota bacterium]
MRYSAACNTIGDSRKALEQACAVVRDGLDGDTPDLAVVFVSAHHAGFEEVPALIAERLGARHLIGCTCETVIGGGEEMEDRPAVSLWTAVMPGVEIAACHAEFERTPDGLLCSGMPLAAEVGFPVGAAIFLGDPYTCAAKSLIARIADDHPGVPLMGGMASSGNAPGENRLYIDGRVVNRGGVGVLIGRGVSVRSVVSQGCRPVGVPFVITKSDENVVHELGGVPAMLRLQEIFDAAGERDQRLLQRGPHVGLAIDEHRSEFGRGDFLISGVLGGDRATGALALGNVVRTGQTLQFHVRDADAADEDLRSLITTQLESGERPQGALLFSCNGRGTRMFAETNHDAGVIQDLAGPIPLAGFFAQGELGPISGSNHLHGFTASLALFGSSPAGSEHDD